MASSNDAQIWGVIAASGSGKGLWIKSQLARMQPRRLIVWDHKDEYAEIAPGPLVANTREVLQAMKAARTGPLRLRFRCKKGTPDKQRLKEFQTLCVLVQEWKNCTYVVEELSNVTMPSWAPPAWREMTTGGRHEGVHIIGVAQNPALIDKTFLSNCTLVHVGPLREFHHRQTVARSIDVPVEKITALVKFQWIEFEPDTKLLREGWSFPPGYNAKNVPTGSGSSGRATGSGIAGRGGAAGPSMATSSPATTSRRNGK